MSVYTESRWKIGFRPEFLANQVAIDGWVPINRFNQVVYDNFVEEHWRC